MGSLIFTGNIFWDWIRSFLSWIDVVFYSAISWFFETIFIIANFQLNVFYEDIQRKVYVILGIFMLFKLLFSFLSYLVNPDKISDKEQGMGKLISRIIIVFVMLLALPTAFDILTELQNRLIPVVPRIIIGYNVSSGDYFDDNTGNIDTAGIANNMSLTIYRSFLKSTLACPEKDNSSSWQDITDAQENINEKCDSGEYVYSYTPIIPLLVAVAMLYVLISLNIDVAIRAFQIIILKSMAPIPIISYVDPKSSKDGMFSKWTKMLLTTWGRLFINLGLIYFVIYIISMVFTAEFWAETIGSATAGGNLITNTLVIVFIIVGLLFFARQAPKFVMDALGIKDQGGFSRMLGMGATALGGIGATRAAFRTRQEYDEKHGGNTRLSALRNAGASLFSGLGAVESGGHALMSADKPKILTGYDAQVKSNAARLARLSTGASLAGGVGSLLDNMFSGQTGIDRMELEWKKAEEQLKYDKQKNAERKTIIDRASSKGLESLATSTDIKDFTGASGEVYNLSGVNAARFNSVVESALSGNGVMRDKIYQKSDGSVISTSDYQSMTASRDQIGATIASYKKQTRGVYRDASGAEITDQNVIDQYNDDPNYGYMNGISYSEDVQYINASGDTISVSDYNSMVDSYNDAVQECNGITETDGKEYFTYNGEKIYVEDAKLLQHEVNDGNIADYAEKVLKETKGSNGKPLIKDDVITSAAKRYADANNGKGVERVFAGENGLKANYGKENSKITEKELKVASEKNSDETKRQQEENKMFNKSGKQ